LTKWIVFFNIIFPYKIDNIKLSLEVGSLEQQIEDFVKNQPNPDWVF